MGFDARFTLALIGWVALLALTLLGCVAAFATPGLVAARIVALAAAGGALAGLWRHVARTNRLLARFVEGVAFGDTALRFDSAGGAGFGRLAEAINAAFARLRATQAENAGELRYLEALVDDLPVAVVTVDAGGQVSLANRAARRLFPATPGLRAEDFASYGATFARRLAGSGAGEELLLLNLDGRSQRVLVRAATLDRLGQRTRVVSVQPIQGTLDAVEMAAQTDLVRVLTHEILNSLTPVTSLADTAADLLAEPDLAPDPRIADARAAVATLARRARGLGHFIDAYRAVARTPQVHRQRFAARAWAEELARLFAAEHPAIPLTLGIVPEGLMLDADPDLMAQVLINLLRNAAQAVAGVDDPALRLHLSAEREGCAITVADNGPGIPPALRQDVFLPFFTTRAGGTGVGLNLARQIVVAHGGTIEAGDAPGGGACFRILL